MSCKDKNPSIPKETVDKDSLHIDITPMFNTDKLVLDNIYTMNNGDLIQFVELKFFLSELTNQNTELIKTASFDFRKYGSNVIRTTGSPNSFSNINGFIGVDPMRNHADPSAFETTNPLYIMNAQDMHWDWNPGYIFLKLEAKMDTVVDGITNLNHSISYHVGGDDFYSPIKFQNCAWQTLPSQVYKLGLVVDLNAFFVHPGQEINWRQECMTHSSGSQKVLSQKVIDNFIAELKPL